MTVEPLVPDLIADLESLGVRLWEDGGQLRFRAPAGVMTEERRSALRGQREAILDHLRGGRGLAITPHPEQRHEPFPLTDVQAAYLLGRRDTFAYGGVACHGYGELTFDQLDVARLETAWRGLVERHDMLRAVIDADGAQRVLPEVPEYRIQVTDVSDVDAGVEAARAELDHRVYQTDRWPLFELRVTRSPQRSVLHFSIDFLICDFVSIQVVLDELSQRYAEPDREWPALSISYRDYLLAERAQRSGSRYERDRGYWTERVDELPPAPELPVSTGAVVPRFRRWAATLGPDDWAALRQRAGRHGITPSGAVLAAYAEVIGAWSRQPRFTLDVTLLNRPAGHPQVNQLVGDFTAVDLLAVTRDPDASLADRAKQAQAQLWADLDHRLYSGVEVMREITRRRGADAALMPVVFTSAIGLGDASPAAGGAGFGTLTYGISQTPQVWIDCQNMERDGGLATNWDVREGVFPDGLIDAAFAAYETLLRRMATDDEVWEATRPVPLPDIQAERRRRVNDTAAPLPDRLLHHDFVAQAARTPDRVALVTPDAELTYGQLLAQAAGIAGRLRTEGCQPGDRVAIVMDKGWRQVTAAYGILLAGAAYLPVDTNQPPARRDQILTGAGVRLVLTQRHLTADGPGIAVEDIPASQAVPEPETHPDDLAYVIYTSGSTGTPKGVMISHRAALNTIVDINRRFGIGPDDRVLGLASLGFDLSVYDIFGPLGIGGQLVLPAADRRSDPTHWADLVAEHGVTVWNSVPAQLQMLHDYLQAAPMPLPTLRLAMLSGDWIPVALPDQIRGLLPGLRLISLGGATEAAIWSIYHPIDTVDPAWRSIPYGVPLANQTFHVLDPALHPCPDWVTGELYIGGAGVAIGYLGDEAKTAERFIRHPDTGERLYRTGDLGRYLPDGTIEFLGREDFQVKIRGHRIELAEVEAAVQSYPGVGAAAVIVDGDGPLDRRLAAIVEPARAATAPATPSGERLVQAATVAGSTVLSNVDNDTYLAYLRQLDDVALAVMVDAFRHAGLFRGPEDRHTYDDIRVAAQVAPRHHRLVRRWLRALVAEGRLGYDPATRAYRLIDAPPADWHRVEQLKATAGDDSDLLRYFRTSAEHLPALLRGDEDPVRLLFPEGRLDVSDNLYADALFNRWANRVAGGAVRAIADAVPRDRPLRVLEVGAGAGGTSAEVLAALDGVPVEYLYTDLSPYFLAEARDRFAESYPHVRFAGYDLDADYRKQGLTPNSFDLVVAGDVLHATRDAGQALARLRELLVPGGWLVFLEMTRDHYQIMTSLELLVRLDAETDDFEDVRQGSGQTFLSREQWLDLLSGSGAELTMSLPGTDDPLADIGMCVFAARVKADRVPVDPAAMTRFLAERLPEYMLPSTVQIVDTLPHSANGKLDRAVMRRWLGASTTATPAGGQAPRTELEDTVAALWAEVLQVERVGRDHDFFDLGGDSLLAAKLAGRLIEEIPAASGVFFDELLRQLLEHPTVGELAGYLAAQDSPAFDPAPVDLAAGGPLRLLAGAGEPAYLLVHDTTGGMDGYGGLAGELAGYGSVYGLAVGEVDGASLDRLVADHATAVRGTGAAAVHVLGYGPGGIVAVELARQLAEGGVEVLGLTVIAPEEPHGLLYRPAVYAADITLVVPDRSVPAAWWSEICLGDLRVVSGGVDTVADLVAGPEDG